MGFVSDVQREWRIPVYIGIDPSALGHDPESPSTSEVIKKIRTEFWNKTLPKYLKFLTYQLTDSDDLCGSHPTIVDC